MVVAGQPVPRVAVVGGGPAGSSAACTLVRRRADVALFEASTYSAWRVGETLPPQGRALLRELGLAQAMQRVDAVTSHGNASAWGAAEIETQSFVFSPYGSGWHLDRTRFDQALAEAAADAGAAVWTGARVTACQRDPTGGFRVRVRSAGDAQSAHPCDGMTVDAVIDATGRAARVARWLGAARRRLDRLAAFAVRFRRRPSATAPSAQTLVEAEPGGWWYSAPLPGDALIAMLMTDPDLAAGEGRDRAAWLARLAKSRHTRRRCDGHDVLDGPRVDTAVSQRLVVPADRACWLAVGDAAMATDPLSASGIMNALRTGRDGAHALADRLNGTASAATAYEAALDTAFDTYCREWRAYYGIEQRWPSATFWRRRVRGRA